MSAVRIRFARKPNRHRKNSLLIGSNTRVVEAGEGIQ